MTPCFITRKTFIILCIGGIITLAAECAVIGIVWLMQEGDLISSKTFSHLIIPCASIGAAVFYVIGKRYVRKKQKIQDSDYSILKR